MRTGIRSRPWAGLDVGSYSVKLLASQAAVAGPRCWLAETVLPKPEGAPDRLHGKEVVARAIAECMAEAGLSPRSFRGIIMGISGTDVIVKQISLPLLDDDEVGPALRFEARKHLPFDPQGMVIDHQVLGRYASTKRIDVLLAAVSQEHVERDLAPLRMLGVDADILDATPLALTNALAHGAGLGHEPYLLLDIGHASSHLTLYQRGEPYFTRRLEFGGRRLTQVIAREIRASHEEAEEWKLAAGSDGPDSGVDWNSREMNAVLGCLQRELVDELRRSFAFYRTVGNLPESFRLWISGGTARLPGLAERLSEMLSTHVLLFNPLEFLPVVPQGGERPVVAPQFTQAFGLALRSA